MSPVSDRKDMRAVPAGVPPSRRVGENTAAELYERHAEALYSLARLLCQNSRSADADEAFVSTLAGAGPMLVNMTPEAERRRLAADLWYRCGWTTALTPVVPGPRARVDGSSQERGQEQALLGLVMFGSHTYTQAAALIGVSAPAAASHLRTALCRGANARRGGPR